ncbi:MAG TPA: LysM peptidoglycan-binding domain-containing protein [Cyclobacteriaceae bacterium]|nr:LysM peptidoglycan-binding domain-containing protein [Cyclobacteriaceae bacterium]
MRFFAAALIFFGAAVSYGQTPEVPHKMQFAGMTLTIRDDARREIQKDVDALTQHPYYFNIKVERAKTYFPLIEKIFQEERLPDDFKYLALQESALISDAVSVSDAVGFWQFKDFTAEEMGMRVDKEIDERMNLISATRGAARYLKQNNFYFNNWVYALQAYQMGAGGAMRAVGDKHNGAKHMDIDKHTYWYVKKYLAHKIAFENALQGESQLKLVPYETDKKTSLDDIAKEFSLASETIAEYNKWAKKGVIPGDRRYTVLIPQGAYDQNFTKLAIASSASPVIVKTDEATIVEGPTFINEVPVIMARPGDQLTTLADRAGLGLTAFIRYNDISIDHVVRPGQHYFVDKKKKKAGEPYHKVAEGENLWFISQEYGIRLKKLKKYNRLAQADIIKPSTMLWMSTMKPPREDVPTDEIAVLDADEEFNWGSRGEGKASKTEAILDDQAMVQPTQAVFGNVEVSSNSQPVSFEPINGEPILHEVKTSDTLYSVSRQYGVTIKQLMEWNSKKDFNLSVGEKLKIMGR